MKFPCLLKFLFIKVQVSSIFKEEQNSLGGTSRNRSRSIGSAVQHFNPYTTEDLHPNPYFVYESLICQRQFGGYKQRGYNNNDNLLHLI